MEQTHVQRGVVMAVLGALLLLQTTPAAQAATAQQFEVVVGEELGVTGSDGKPLSAVSLRFLPENIEVHSGDVLHFTSDVPLQGIALLPPSVGPSCEEWTSQAAADGRCPPRQWIEDHAFSLESPWYPLTLDPDEKYVKVNNAAAFPPSPPCGNPGQGGPCSFPLTPGEQEAQDARWGFAKQPTAEGAKGVLGSGLSQGGARTLDFSVEVTAAQGTVFWAISMFAKEAHLRVTVVGDDQPVASPHEVRAAGDAQLAADRATAVDLDARYSNYRNRLAIDRGASTWEALLGVEAGPVALRQAYPRTLEILRGDKVRWTSRHIRSLVHTVTFPGAEVHDGPPLLTTHCDVDGDEGSLPDQDPTFASPVFCPGGPSQVEFDLSTLVGAPDPDVVFTGTNDFAHSGVRGMAPGLDKPAWPRVAPREPYELQFTAKSGTAGFQYACALHGALQRDMSGTVVVR